MNPGDEVLLILIGFGSLLVAAGLWLILPVVSWMRVSRVKRELADVQARLAALESAEASRLGAAPERAAAPPIVTPPIAPPIVPPRVRPGAAGRDAATTFARCRRRAGWSGRSTRRRVHVARGRDRRAVDVVGRRDRAGAGRRLFPEVRIRQRVDYRIDARGAGRGGRRRADRCRPAIQPARLQRVRPDRHRRRPRRAVSGDLCGVQLLRPDRTHDDLCAARDADGGCRRAGRPAAGAWPGADGRRRRICDAVSRRGRSRTRS